MRSGSSGIFSICAGLLLASPSCIAPAPDALAAQAAAQAVNRLDAAQANQFIADLGAQAINVLQRPGQTIEQREAIFRNILSQKFALEFIGRFVLGRHWQSFSADQREDYLALFSEFVLSAYASNLGGYADEKFQVLGVIEAGQQDMIVNSRITGSGREAIQVDWRVRRIDAQPQIIDVAVGGISMSITQREEFSALIQRDGVQGLLEVLRARTLRLPAEGIQ
ncbi:MAG: MlaC/ttg2D family ABC transporter substrate-binding protein [Pseudomonadota bacterium]